VFGHAVSGLVDAIFDGVADAGEAFEVGRVKTEVVGFFGGFDDEAVGEVDHGIVVVGIKLDSIVPYAFQSGWIQVSSQLKTRSLCCELN